MGIVWALVGAGAAGIGLGVWLFVRARRHRTGRAFSILGGVVLILAALVLLACYLPIFVLPDVRAETAVFNQPAPLDPNANVFFISSAEVDYGGTSVPTDTLVAIAARTGAVRWQRTLPGTRSQVVAEGDMAYVATLQSPPAGTVTVAAYRGADGALLWQTTAADRLPHAELAVSGGVVYFLAGEPQSQAPVTVVALRAADGMRLWSAASSIDVSQPLPTLVAAPDAVYLSTIAGLQVYRSSDAKPLWKSDQHLSSTGVVVGAGFDVLLSASGGFEVVRASDGAPICQLDGNFVAQFAALDGGSLYLGGIISGAPTAPPPYPSAVYAYDAATCTPRWHEPYVASDLLAAGGAVYIIAADSGTVVGVRGADGKALWHSDAVTSTLGGMGWRFSTQPALVGTTLFATSGILGGGIHVLGGYGWIHLYAFGGGSGFNYWHVPIGHRTSFSVHLGF